MEEEEEEREDNVEEWMRENAEKGINLCIRDTQVSFFLFFSLSPTVSFAPHRKYRLVIHEKVE